MGDELNENCSLLNDYKNFLNVCLWRAGQVDFFDMIKIYLVKLSEGCRANGKYPLELLA